MGRAVVAEATLYRTTESQRLEGGPEPCGGGQVTLMQHFKNYLDETHPNRDSPSHASAAANPAGEDGAGVYVRKWMRTRHSIIFRLSNNCFQVRAPPPLLSALARGPRTPRICAD